MMQTLEDIRSAKAEMDLVQHDLVTLVDAFGLETVLAALRELCYAKANTIAVGHQDIALAKQWLAWGLHCNAAAMKVGQR